MKKVKVLYLYSVFAGYVESIVRGLSERDNIAPIDIIHWERRGVNSTRYELPTIDGVNFYNRNDFNDASLLKFLKLNAPDIIYVSGWMDKGYLKAISLYRNSGDDFKVVCGIDDQWEGTIRQYLGKIYFKIFYKKIFDYMWVAGKPQYHYAKQFGYQDKNIISNLLSAEPHFFNSKSKLNRRFVFVGRLDPVKGLDILINAYKKLTSHEQELWPLVIIGSGEMDKLISEANLASIIHIPFLQRDDLLLELSKGGVGCLSSNHEQWGVVVHEFAAMGMPLLLSDKCGSASEFLINGGNGFSFKRGSSDSLYHKMKIFIDMDMSSIELMSNKSRYIASRITPDLTIDSLLSIRWSD